MKLNDAALTTTASVKAQSRLRALAFLVTSTSNNYAAFVAAYAACTVEILKETVQGVEQIFAPRKLTDLFEIAGAEMGGIMCTSDGANSTIRSGVELSDYGFIECLNNEFIKINLVGIPAGDSIDIYGIDAPVSSKGWHNVFEVVAIDATTPKTVLIPNTKMLALPVATTTRVEITWANGSVNAYEPEELKSMTYETNEVCINENGVVTGGFSVYYVINVAEANFAKITCSAATSVIKKDYKQL